jgi:iron complex outermembrane receptor protein
MTITVKRVLALLVCTVVGVAAEATVEPGASIEEIIVTARKRAENLDEVPDSITAFTAQQIEEQRINRISDAIAAAPNVHIVMDQDAGTNIITVRGIGTNRNLAASVAYVVDGVILPDSDAFTADLSDVERIEILRGPQGGLYGRNAIAGVINLTTKRPTSELEGEIKAGYGNGETLDVFGALSGPLVADTLLGRVTVKYHDSDGFIRNQFDGKYLDPSETLKTTGRLILNVSDALSLDLRGSWFDEKTGALWFSAADVLGTTGGEITDDMAQIRPNQNDDPYSDRTIYDLSLVAELETGAGTFTSITAYDDIDVEFLEDLDVSPLTITNDAMQTRRTRGVSQELRFPSPGERRLRAHAGAYAQNTTRDVATSVQLDFCFLLALPFCPTPPGVESGILVPVSLNTTEGEFDQWALFAQANYDITDQIELTIALRYDEDRREQLDVLLERRDEATFSDLQPKVSLAWQARPDLMLYATYAEGYKSGAFNPPPPPGAAFPLVVDQEGTDSYELGLKGSWLDERIRLKAAAYYTDYTDVQIFQLDITTGGQVAINANEAEIKGAEIELAARLWPGLDFSIGYGYTDATFTDFNGTGLNDGNRLPNAPRYGTTAAVRYERPLAAGLTLISRVDYHRTGTIYFAEDNLVYQPSYDTVDAQISVEGDRWMAMLWGRNVFDEHYVTSAYSRFISPLIFGALGVDPLQIAPGAQYGVELRWRF